MCVRITKCIICADEQLCDFLMDAVKHVLWDRFTMHCQYKMQCHPVDETNNHNTFKKQTDVTIFMVTLFIIALLISRSSSNLLGYLQVSISLIVFILPSFKLDVLFFFIYLYL